MVVKLPQGLEGFGDVGSRIEFSKRFIGAILGFYWDNGK